MKKKVCINIPCFNEEENVVPLCEELIKLFDNQLSQYEYLIQFIDNDSEDSTQEKISYLCDKYSFVRAIFNAKNFKGNSALYGMLQSEGDCTIYLSADFQDPIEKIPELLEKWEEGHLIVAAIKTQSKENKIKYAIRKLYYKIMKNCSTVGFIEQFCNFGVYDKKFLDIIRGLKNPNYSIRGNVAQYGYDICYVEYEQQERRSGKSNYNVWKLLNLGVVNFVDYTEIIIRFGTVLSVFLAAIDFMALIVMCILKIAMKKVVFNLWIFALLIVFIGLINIFFSSIVGEYVISVRKKVTDSPLVVEKKRINFN